METAAVGVMMSLGAMCTLQLDPPPPRLTTRGGGSDRPDPFDKSATRSWTTGALQGGQARRQPARDVRGGAGVGGVERAVTIGASAQVSMEAVPEALHPDSARRRSAGRQPCGRCEARVELRNLYGYRRRPSIGGAVAELPVAVIAPAVNVSGERSPTGVGNP